MRKINEIIIHCTATTEGKPVDVAEINRWHIQRGWKGTGYHYVIGIDGKVQLGRPIEEIGAHCVNHNANSIGIAYVGGLDKQGKPKDTRTVAQRAALRKLVDELLKKYPCATVHTHNEFTAKACPCFNIKDL